VSPQRLVHYRNTWYLDAWCHQKGQIRMFALDAIDDARILEMPSRNVSLEEVDRELGGGYGIYRGRNLQWATLVFSAETAKWVRSERWHDKQQINELGDGRLELKVPYRDPAELELEILRHGEHVQVIGPTSLRKSIVRRLARTARLYETEVGPTG
jgi:predicted DNA-binding transcriptional regulator YafY